MTCAHASEIKKEIIPANFTTVLVVLYVHTCSTIYSTTCTHIGRIGRIGMALSRMLVLVRVGHSLAAHAAAAGRGVRRNHPARARRACRCQVQLPAPPASGAHRRALLARAAADLREGGARHWPDGALDHRLRARAGLPTTIYLPS